MSLSLEDRRKRLRYRTSHTGMKETDILFGGFIIRYGPTLEEALVGEAEALLDANDQDIYNWITGRAPVPDAFETRLMARLQEFVRERNKL